MEGGVYTRQKGLCGKEEATNGVFGRTGRLKKHTLDKAYLSE